MFVSLEKKFLMLFFFTEKLYGLLEDYCAAQQASGWSHVDLFEFIRNTIRPSRSLL